MSADSTPRLVGAQTSKSFSRMEDTSSSSFPRNRAKAVQGILTQDVEAETSPLTPLDPDPLYGESDLFAKRDSIDLADGRLLGKPDASHSQLPYPADHFELPIELASLTDRLVIDL